MSPKIRQYLPRIAPRFVAIGIIFISTVYTTAAQSGFQQTGIASYYAEDFNGRVTATGEIYNMDSLTAAHQSLPFHTRVRVTNLENNRSVVVRINDEGPLVKGRIIDVSKAAARILGMMETGTARVRLDVVSSPPKREFEDEFYSIAARRVHPRGYAVQVASFSDLGNLLRRLDALRAKGFDELFVRIGGNRGAVVYRLVSRGFPTQAAAETQAAAFRKAGLPALVFKIR